MPFISVVFANHDHSNALQQKAQNTLNEADAGISLISRLLCIHRPSSARKRMHYLVKCSQKIYLLLLGALLVSALVILAYDHSKILVLIYVSSLIDIFLLLWWNQSSVIARFPAVLLEATSGVGSVKRRKTIKATQKFTFLILLFLSICYISIFLISSIFLHDRFSNEIKSIIYISLLAISLFIGLLSTVAATTLFTTRLSLISAEFHTHSDDFRQDGNTFQTCVSKHYALIHSKIINLFGKVRFSFSLWFSLHFILDLIQFYIFLTNFLRLVKTDKMLHENPVHLLLSLSHDLLFPLCIPLSRLLFALSAVHRLHVASHRFTAVLISLLCTENKMINDQTYLACMAYCSHLHSSDYQCLLLFGFPLKRELLFKFTLLTISLIFITYSLHL